MVLVAGLRVALVAASRVALVRAGCDLSALVSPQGGCAQECALRTDRIPGEPGAAEAAASWVSVVIFHRHLRRGTNRRAQAAAHVGDTSAEIAALEGD
jgi:hypothetical protein